MTKKMFITLALVLVTFTANALLASDAVAVTTISDEQTTINFTLPKFDINEHTINNQTFATIDMPQAFASADEGLPDLPHFSATIAVPIGSIPTLAQVTQSQPRYIPTLPITPVQNQEAPDYTFHYDASFYQSNNIKVAFPQSSYMLSEVFTVRDYQFVVVKIYPIKYLPAQKSIEITDSFQFTINHHSKGKPATYTLRPTISKAFEKIYEHTFDNYHQIRLQDPVYQEQSILIIYGGNSNVLSPTFMGYLNNIENLKKQKGFEVTAVSTITTGTTTTAIKSYIQNLYDTAENPPEWIILLGHTGNTYTIPRYNFDPINSTNDGHTDYPYSFLSGGDYIGDAFLGRISVSNENELNTYWQKIQKYELNIPNTDPILYKKSLLVGQSNPNGISCIIINRYIKSLILQYIPTAVIQEIYDDDYYPGSVQMAFNAGHGNFNFRGFQPFHGVNYNQVTNTNILTNCMMLTCNTGDFYDPGPSEGLIRRSYQSSPAGAIVATGMSTGMTKVAYNNAVSGAIFYAMYALDVASIGEAVLYGKIYVNKVYPGNQQTACTNHWINTMGDPSLYIFKTTPNLFATTLPTTFPAGTQGFRLVITDTNGNIIPEAWVTISTADGSYVSKAISGHDGVAFLTLDPQQAGLFTFAISKPGFHTLRGGATITGNPAVTVVDKMIYDPAPGGNNSQTINPGETINLSIKVKNFTSNNISDLTATISSESEYVTITGATTASLGSIGAGLEVLYDDAFTFEVSPLAPDKILLPFTFNIYSGESSWTSYLLLEVKGIDLKIVDTNPRYLNIGNSTSISFSLQNLGTTPTGSLQATLISHSPYMTSTDNVVAFPNINIGDTATNSTPFTVYVDDNLIAGMILKADLHLFNNNGFQTDIPVNLPIGYKVIGDPTGPDDYGYVIYHSSDTDIINRPTYNWINIANIGTNTGITDINTEQEEDSQLVMLPFTASFFGQQYDTITICSNGWLAFGETGQKDFRNLPLPGPIAPRPLIAPYWTDLIIGGSYGGGVYTYNHPTEHAFIVQFDKVRWITAYRPPNGGPFIVSADSVSFQVLIYDPAYNEPTGGDSKIKIQYRRFNPGIPGDDRTPFNYITVGIQDQIAQTGIEYVYNNIYSAGSNTLTSGSALLITKPVLPPLTEGETIGYSDVFTLSNNYPNPFNPQTTIKFTMGRENKVNLNIYNIKGQLVRQLVNNVYGVGEHQVIWNGQDELGHPAGSGVYFIRMTAGGYSAVRKMVLLK